MDLNKKSNSKQMKIQIIIFGLKGSKKTEIKILLGHFFRN